MRFPFIVAVVAVLALALLSAMTLALPAVRADEVTVSQNVAIQPGWLGCVSWGPGLAVAAGMAWFLIFGEPAWRVVLVTDRRL